MVTSNRPTAAKGEMMLRRVGAVAVLASVAIHGWLWLDGMRAVHVIGPAFLVNVIAGAVIAVLLLRWRHWLPGALTACFGVATLGAFTLASTIGLFGTHEKWEGFYVFGAAVCELVAILVGLALMLDDPDPEPTPALAESQSAGANRSERA